MFDEVDEALGEKLTAVMWEGPADRLTLTENAQPALMAVSLAAMRVLESEAGVDLKRDAAFVAGHSLGEYSALAAAGSLTHRRHRAAAAHSRPRHAGGGAGRRRRDGGADRAGVRCGRRGRRGSRAGRGVQAANDNGGGQVVVSGDKAAVERAVEIAKGKGAKRAMMLPVSAPFHCALMQPAADAMAQALGTVTVKPPVVPVVANVLARPISDPAEIVRAGRAGDRHGALARVASPSWPARA